MSHFLSISAVNNLEEGSAHGYSTIADPVRGFASAVYRELGVTIDPSPDGKIHRFDCPEGRRGNNACWYALFLDTRPAGVFGNWRTGLKFTWSEPGNNPLTAKERERQRGLMRLAQEQRLQEKVQAQEAAIHLAKMGWGLGRSPDAEHPYLVKKRISGNYLRQSGNILLVMLQDIDGRLLNLQRIYLDGSKRFLKGGRVRGCFWLCGNYIPESGTLYIAEGVATAATIAEAVRAPVVAAMNAGNLKPVAEAIRKKYPGLTIVVAADNDHRTAGNPGINKAMEAAASVGGCVTWPTICFHEGCTCTDFNDLEHCERAVK